MTRVAAIVGCVDAEGRVLLVKQLGGPFAGAWVLPGGGVEPGEAIELGARRELLEETGYSTGSLALVVRYDVRALDGSFAIDLHMFKAGELTGTARAEDESALRWSPGDDLPLHPVVAVELADLGLLKRDASRIAHELSEIGITMRRVDQR